MAQESVTRPLERWRLIEEVAHGGWGTVYRAEDADGRPGALKTLLPSDPKDRDEALARFRREERLLRRLHHPHLVSLIDSGEIAGKPFLILEWLPGPDLFTRVVERGPLSIGDTLAVGRAAADVLSFLHGEGVIHRDLKPSNFSFDGAGVLRLIDLGLAADPTALQTVTTRGAFLGTVGFAAPEVAAGEEAGPESDVYGLGMVLYWCLTGRAPFTGSTERTVLRRQARDEVLSPSVLRSRIPAALTDLVRAMLEADPGKRPPGARGVAEALERISPNDVSRGGRTKRVRRTGPTPPPEAARPPVPRSAPLPARPATPASDGPEDVPPPNSMTIIKKGFARKPGDGPGPRK